MKTYKTPEIELLNIKLSAYCELLNTSSFEIDNPSESGGTVNGGFGQVEAEDDL